MAEEFVVQFVLLDEEDQNQMQRAEEAVRTTANLPTQVINGAAALELTKPQKNALVVCDPFEGEVYEHLKALKCRIVGPQCVLSCLKLGKAIPKADYPIYNLAMRNVVISCSSMDKKERATIHELVQLMGGRVVKDFTSMVTHLVAGEVSSKKYHVAVKLGKPIMLPEWIRACWEQGKTRHIDATDEEFQEYKCPVFQGIVVCVTGLDSVDRQEIRTQVEQHGGRYSGELRLKECTHLVAKEPKGAKYEFARKWKLHCVTTRWFYQSLEAGVCQDENLYRLDRTNNTEDNKTSTPSQERKAPRFSTQGIADISTISTASSRGNMSHVNETNLCATRLDSLDETRHDELDNLDVSNIDAGTFLDGCMIFLSGFAGTRLEKLRKIVNAGGGMRFNQLNEKVSHVVMSGPDEQLADKLSAENLRPHVVTTKWLVECVKAGKQVSEEPFYCLEFPPMDPTSPVQPKKTEKKTAQPPPPSEEPKDEDETQIEEEEPAEDDIMSQYLAEAEEEEDNTTIEAPQERQEPTEQEEEDEVVFMKLEERRPEEEEEEDNDVTVAMDEDCQTEMEEEGGGGVFEGKLFSFYSFTEQQTAALAELVGENGGSVVKSGSRAVPNYAVVPVLGFPEGISAEEIVTDCWLNVCLEQETLLSPEHNPLFTPLTFKPDCMPLVGCVLSLSQYAGVEREFLSGIAEELGACCQEFFVKKAQPSKNLQASTHLLCKTPEGSKYQAAKKWKLPAVTSDWIFQCGRTGKKLPEEKFLVSNIQQQPQEPAEDKPAKIPKAEHHESRPKEAKLDATPSDTPGPSKDSPGNKENRQEDRRTSTVPKQQASVPSTSTSTQKKSPPAKEQLKSPLEKEDRTRTTAQKSSEPPISKEQDGRKDTNPPQVIPKNKTPVLSKEPLAAKKKTPILSKELPSGKKNKRLTELQQSQVKIDTPSKFLSKGVVFKPSFDMQDAFDALQSPAVVGNQGQRKRARRSSVPLDALLQQNLEKALSNFSKEGHQPALGMQQGEQEEEEEEEEEEEVFTKEPSPPRPLAGVVIYVSKKLSKQQSDYNDLACSLGADYRWTYDESVTHFIFQGRANDTTKEFRTARSQGKTIVSPHWLQVCEEQEARVDETLFPHTYNPKLSLSQAVVSKTPARSTRSSSRRKDSEQQENQDSTEGEEDQGQDRPPLEQQGGTLEMREDFQRQFEEIMSATRVTRSSRRRTKRLNDSTGTPSASDDSAKRFSTRSRTRAPSQTSKVDSKDRLSGQEQTKSSAKCPENFTEASQSIQITWDDPTGRQERERIAEQLRYRASPTQELEELAQDGQAFMARMSGETTNQEQGPGQMRLLSANNRASSTSPNQGADRSFGEDEPTPTPEGPSIAFPIARPAVPHPTTVTRAQGEEEEEVQKQVYIFQMSGMTPQEKMDYSGLIEELGGEVIDKQTFDPRCTHIVVGNPNRNEKYLSALAMGRWILHRSYMEACREAKAFVEEEPHEWGTATDVSSMPENVARLALAARRWRQNLADLRAQNADPDINAFQNWGVLLHVDQSRASGFKRLLESGGARVLSARPPHSNIHEATHAFIELKGKGVDQSLDIQALVQAGVWCLKSEYIADYLMQDPIPKPQNFVISEALPHMTGTETPRKRKASSASGVEGKRSKRL